MTIMHMAIIFIGGVAIGGIVVYRFLNHIAYRSIGRGLSW